VKAVIKIQKSDDDECFKCPITRASNSVDEHYNVVTRIWNWIQCFQWNWKTYTILRNATTLASMFLVLKVK